MPAIAHHLPPVWHANALASAPTRVVRTGNALLNAQLPGGGWPQGALIEVLQAPGVHSEWRLLMPALVQCGQGLVVLVGAPHVPFAPALAAQGLQTHRLLCVTAPSGPDRLWATEQVLRCAEVDAVLAWLDQAQPSQLRRLQIAAAEHAKLLFVMRPAQALRDASPAVLRLLIGPSEPVASRALADPLRVRVLKRRGPPLEQDLYLQALASGLSLLLASHALDRATAAV
jgi:protein ImuA